MTISNYENVKTPKELCANARLSQVKARFAEKNLNGSFEEKIKVLEKELNECGLMLTFSDEEFREVGNLTLAVSRAHVCDILDSDQGIVSTACGFADLIRTEWHDEYAENICTDSTEAVSKARRCALSGIFAQLLSSDESKASEKNQAAKDQAHSEDKTSVEEDDLEVDHVLIF